MISRCTPMCYCPRCVRDRMRRARWVMWGRVWDVLVGAIAVLGVVFFLICMASGFAGGVK